MGCRYVCAEHIIIQAFEGIRKPSGACAFKKIQRVASPAFESQIVVAEYAMIVSLAIVGTQDDGLDSPVLGHKRFEFRLALGLKGLCLVADEVLFCNIVWHARINRLLWQDIIVVIVNDDPFVVTAINACDRSCERGES